MELDALLDKLAELVAEKLAAKNGDGHATEPPDTLLDAKAAAARLAVSARWLYGHDLPFAVRLPNSRTVRYSARGLTLWLEKRMGR